MTYVGDIKDFDCDPDFTMTAARSSFICSQDEISGL